MPASKSKTQRIDLDGKVQRSITLDKDVDLVTEEHAQALRKSFSALVNELLAREFGMIQKP